ncbi:MAG: serine/threonine-protein phosphatase [Acidobacteria bacterium]|nr:serine/threonine-protein phosphatase [Acidobacteriota bacterium]
MATTAVAMLIDGGTATLAHVGDSRVYRLRDGQLERLTRDHSWVEEQIRLGALSETAARQHPWRNIVTRALSGSDDLEVDIQEVALQSGDRLLLCSDGLFTVLSDGQISEVLRRETDLDHLCHALIQGANDGGGPDNVTAVVLELYAV